MGAQHTIITDNILQKFSSITSENFLKNQYISNNFLNVALENLNGEKIYFSIKSPFYYLSELNNQSIFNIGQVDFLQIDRFLETDENGYFKYADRKNFHHIIAKNMMKIAIGLNCKDYSHIGFFKGYSILNAFLLGNENIKTFTLNNQCILSL